MVRWGKRDRSYFGILELSCNIMISLLFFLSIRLAYGSGIFAALTRIFDVWVKGMEWL